jgi:6-phosphogluconate dehydrogenase
MRFGMIGLGRMGSGIARRAVKAGHECVGYDRDGGLVTATAKDGVEGAASPADLIGRLPAPRVVWVMVPVGVTGAVVDELIPLFEAGDVLIDGGNSNYRDSIARASEAARAEVRYLDVGTSGGVFGAERGFCLMAGGDSEAFARAEHAQPVGRLAPLRPSGAICIAAPPVPDTSPR